MATKYQTNYFSSAANANAQLFNFTTYDDNVSRRLTALYSNVVIAGASVSLAIQGQFLTVVDCLRFATGNYPVHPDLTIPAGLQLQVFLQDLAGAAHVNWGIVIKYEVPSQ